MMRISHILFSIMPKLYTYNLDEMYIFFGKGIDEWQRCLYNRDML